MFLATPNWVGNCRKIANPHHRLNDMLPLDWNGSLAARCSTNGSLADSDCPLSFSFQSRNKARELFSLGHYAYNQASKIGFIRAVRMVNDSPELIRLGV